MTLFILVAALLLLCLLAVLLRPLLRPAALTSAIESPALAVLREQRRELEAEHAAGRMEAGAFAEAMQELEARVLEELSPATTEPAAQTGVRGWVWGLMLGLPLLALASYAWLGTPAALDAAQRDPAVLDGKAQLAAMVTTLAERVAADPEDLEAARMLGRAYMLQGRHAEAAAQFGALVARQPQDAQLLADWADALASAQGNRLTGEPEQRVREALALDPDNIKALALAGTAAFEREDHAEAVRLWERMLARVTPGSELAQSAAQMLAEARRRGGLEAPPPLLGVQGELSLAPALQAQVQADDTVFLVLRPAGGGMPLAALRFQARELPLRFDFAQAAMMLPAVPEGPLELLARVSRTGEASPRKGDPESAVYALGAMTKGVALQIDRVRE